MHDELDGVEIAKAPYGVTVESDASEGLGYTFRRDGQVMGQLYTDRCEEMNIVRLALNRAAAALWGQQPAWPADCFFRAV